MWNEKRSMMLSKVCTILACVALVAALAGGPWLIRWLLLSSSSAKLQYQPFFYATFYVGGVLLGLLLIWLYRLLVNIGAGRVFTHQNVRLLRQLSWFCFAGAGVAVVSGIYYLAWGLVGLAAAFVALIIRVVKNVFAQAVQLKEENDYTI